VAALLMIVLAVYSIKNRGVPGAIPFTFACIFALLWMFGSVLEYAAVDMGTKIFWRKFTVIWQLPSATAIYVRLTGASVGTFSGNITHSSTGATQKTVAVVGTVNVVVPTDGYFYFFPLFTK
jgi:hypothetical protein